MGNGEHGVQNNNPKVYCGGKLIHDLLETEKFILLNNSEKCSGGPFTRVDPSNPEVKSCLDLCIISKGLYKYVMEMIIDVNLTFTPHRSTKTKLTFSDHFSVLVKFRGIPEVARSYQKDGKTSSWNTNKEDGWVKYKQLTTENEKLDDLATKADRLNSNELMEGITKLMNKIKFQSFGKVKISQGLERNKELDELYKLKSKAVMENNENEANNLDEKIGKELLCTRI